MKVNYYYSLVKNVAEAYIVIIKKKEVIWKGHTTDGKINKNILNSEVETIYYSDNGLAIKI